MYRMCKNVFPEDLALWFQIAYVVNFIPNESSLKKWTLKIWLNYNWILPYIVMATKTKGLREMKLCISRTFFADYFDKKEVLNLIDK